jgi:hypothetical protein
MTAAVALIITAATISAAGIARRLHHAHNARKAQR